MNKWWYVDTSHDYVRSFKVVNVAFCSGLLFSSGAAADICWFSTSLSNCNLINKWLFAVYVLVNPYPHPEWTSNFIPTQSGYSRRMLADFLDRVGDLVIYPHPEWITKRRSYCSAGGIHHAQYCNNIISLLYFLLMSSLYCVEIGWK
jgi:hypothetical protein